MTPLSLMLPPPASSGTTSEVHPSSAPRRHMSRSKPALVPASSRIFVVGHWASRNFRVVSSNSC